MSYHSDVDARDINLRTPLFHATLMNNIRAVAILIVNGAHAFAIDKDGTPLEEVSSDSQILTMIRKGRLVRLS